MSESIQAIAQKMVSNYRGILAADESTPSAKKRLDSIGIESTEETRRQYRNVFFSTDSIGEYISGVILFEETLTQKADDGTPFVELLQKNGIIPGIKVDKGAKDMALFDGEKITEGLDGLRDRLEEYYKIGCRFAKWRAVITIDGDSVPTEACIAANAHALARYAALVQEAGMVPIVEPEVLYDNGNYDIKRAEEVTTQAHIATFDELKRYNVDLSAVILKPSMVLASKEFTQQSTLPDHGKLVFHLGALCRAMHCRYGRENLRI